MWHRETKMVRSGIEMSFFLACWPKLLIAILLPSGLFWMVAFGNSCMKPSSSPVGLVHGNGCEWERTHSTRENAQTEQVWQSRQTKNMCIDLNGFAVQPTSSIFGMISRSHCLRKESLSKEGSTFKISVSTSDISVFEKSPPWDKWIRHTRRTNKSYYPTDKKKIQQFGLSITIYTTTSQ